MEPGPERDREADPEAELDRALSDLGREREMHLRTRADLENYRRRVERDAERAARDGRRGLILSLLDVIADLDRAIDHAEGTDEAIRTGVIAIRRRLESLLAGDGVVGFESLGRPFDPRRHEAVASVEAGAESSGTVIQEVSRGYTWGDEVLRPARVVVGR